MLCAPRLCSDEIHLVLGAGKAEGAMDAANLLKPMLARGELRLVGATTLDEYREHVEKDAAFERRFQQVRQQSCSSLPCGRAGQAAPRTAGHAEHCSRPREAQWAGQAGRAMQPPVPNPKFRGPEPPSLQQTKSRCAACCSLPIRCLPILPTTCPGPSPPCQVLVGEPSVPDTVQILRGLKERCVFCFRGVC